MLFKKNSLDRKAFCKTDWRQLQYPVKGRQLIGRVLAWLCNPQGDHGLEYAFLEGMALAVGLRVQAAAGAETVTFGFRVEEYGSQGLELDVVVETRQAYLVFLPVTDPHHMDNGQVRKELEERLEFLKDNLRRNKSCRIILLVMDKIKDGWLRNRVGKGSFVSVLDYDEMARLAARMVNEPGPVKGAAEMREALERMELALKVYLAGVAGREHLAARLRNLKKIL